MSEHDFELDPAPITTSPPEVSEKTESPFGDVIVGNDELDTAVEKTDLDISTKISHSQEQTRAKIAWTFTQIFLLLITVTLVLPSAVSIAYPELIKDPVETTKTLMTVVASVLAGPFGFIVGFYFKQEKEIDRG